MRIRKDDMVKVISGKDRGKVGKVLRVFPRKGRILVEGVNLVKKHLRPSVKQQKSGIIEREAPLDCSNLQIFCTGCSRPTRVGIRFLSDGSRERYCKKCGQPIKG